MFIQAKRTVRGERLIYCVVIFCRAAVGTLISVAVLWAAAVNVCARGGSKEWVVLKDCEFIPNPANDGDSFHVSSGRKEYLFRLYFVDAPETDEMTPGRLVEQAKYFGITVPEAIEAGRAAKEFTRQRLSMPFTVFTHMSDALGQSRLERFYAFVQTKEGDLGELLVKNGLARNHGFKAIPPGINSSRVELEKLQRFEEQARQEKIGAWGVSAGRLNVNTQSPASVSSFASEDSSATPHPIIPSTRIGPVETNKRDGKNQVVLGRIDINTATEKELTTVPGIGHVTAARIITARPFRSADDLRRVSGIGDKKYAQIRPYFQ